VIANEFAERQSDLIALINSEIVKSAIHSMAKKDARSIDEIREQSGTYAVESGQCTFLFAIERNLDVRTIKLFETDCDQRFRCTKDGENRFVEFNYSRVSNPKLSQYSFVKAFANSTDNRPHRINCGYPVPSEGIIEFDTPFTGYLCGNQSDRYNVSINEKLSVGEGGHATKQVVSADLLGSTNLQTLATGLTCVAVEN
jgi:hypothetical protein